MFLLANIFTYIFDLFILVVFINNLLGTRKPHISRIIVYSSFVAAELTLFVNDYFTRTVEPTLSLIICVGISFLTTLMITLFYQSSLQRRFLATTIFQIIALFGEYAFTGVITKLYPEIYEFSYRELSIIMNLGSKLVLFVIVLLLSTIFSKEYRSAKLNHALLVFTTPLITVIIMFFTPLREMSQNNNRTFFTCLYICLALLNIVNYVLIHYDYRQSINQFRLKQSEALIQFQQDNYKKLSSAYKANRSLIHDTKKHYFVIKKYIENQEYTKLLSYLDITISNMEQTYSEINTGNLVIDSFATNFMGQCAERKIDFSTDLSIDCNRIPISDYELCTILGNLLDNAINACTLNSTMHNYIRLTITITDNDIFYIQTVNTYNHEIKETPKDNDIFSKHGYGLKNIRETVEQNNGVINITKEETFCVDIVIPITKDKQRISRLSSNDTQNRFSG